jgi:hypothetical protein
VAPNVKLGRPRLESRLQTILVERGVFVSPASFRFRYLLGLLCHVAVSLVACNGSPTSASSPAPVLASCGLEPSFPTSGLKRWEEFPVDVQVDLSSFPESVRDVYREGVERGIRLWAEATSGRIGVFHIHYDRPSSPVTIRLSDVPLPDNAIGSTALTYTANLIVSASVQLTRSSFEGTPFLSNDVASTTAHEIGHVLGIVDHSPYREDKMWISGNFGVQNEGRDPLSLLTPRDVNTLREAYCR